jgi:protein SCO1/2
MRAVTIKAAIAMSVMLLTAGGGVRAEVPSDSLYNIDVPLETAAGRHIRFSTGAGRVRIVTMFYANCPMACPLIIDTLKNLDSGLDPHERERLDILMVSMDPSHDTPAALTRVTHERRISDARWTLARASVPDTRKLAAILGIQYRELADGTFDHTSTLVLLDPQGRVLARSSKLGMPATEFLYAVKRAVGPGGY